MNFSEEGMTIPTFDGLSLPAYISCPLTEIRGVALLISGGGFLGEEGDVSGPFVGTGYQGQPAPLNWQLRDQLCDDGFIVLRYAKRPLATQSISNLVEDARVALEILCKRHPHLPVSLVGFSEGAIVATLLAEVTRINSLHLISPPLRSIDTCLEYQFVDWGVTLLEEKLDQDRDGFVTQSDFLQLDMATLPVIGIPIDHLHFDADKRISTQNGIRPTYQWAYQQARQLLETPDLKAWYTSMKKLGDLREVLTQLSCQIYLYQGTQDSQVNIEWLVDDHASRHIRGELRIFPGLGHALAPMEGRIGEKKTSGPFDGEFLNQLAQDLKRSTIP